MAPTFYSDEPDHPVLPMPAYYEVVRVDWSLGGDEPFLDLWVREKGHAKISQVRFGHPAEVRIDEGFAGFNSGFRVKDISSRGLELRVAVTSFEQDPAIHFLARSVELLD
jgi:hypothetical protein